MHWPASDFFYVLVKPDTRYLRAVIDGVDGFAGSATPKVLKLVVKEAEKSSVEC